MSLPSSSAFSDKLDALSAQWVDWVRRHAKLVLALGIALTLASAVHLSLKLRIITNTDEMLSTELPFRMAEHTIYTAFPELKEVLVIIIDGNHADAADDAATLLAQKLRTRPDLFRTIFAPSDDPFLRQHGLLYLSPTDITAMSDRLEESRDTVGLMAQDPSLRGFFAVLGDALRGLRLGYAHADEASSLFNATSEAIENATANRPGQVSWRDILAGGKTTKDDRRRFILVQPVIDYTSFDPGGPAMDAIRSFAADAGITAEQGLRLRLTGDVALYREELQTVNQGMLASTLISIFLGTIILAVGMSSWRLSLACLAVLCAGLLWTASFGLIAVGRFNVISITFAAMFVGLGIDYAAHLGLRYREARQEGSDHAEALRVMAASQFSPLLWCTLTSIISFCSFAPTAYKGIAELGLISSGGMILSVIINYTLLPAVLTVLPVRFRVGPQPVDRKIAFPFRRFLMRRPGTILAGTLIACLIASWGASKIWFDPDLLSLRDPKSESVMTLREMIHEGDYSAMRVIGIVPNMEAATAAQQRLASLPSVARSEIITDFVPKDQPTKLAALEKLKDVIPPPEDTVPAPTAEETKASFVFFRDRLQKILDGPNPSPVAERLAAALDNFTATQGTGPEALAKLQDRLIGALPRRLNDLRQGLSAGLFTLNDLPQDLRNHWISSQGQSLIAIYPREAPNNVPRMAEFVADVRTVVPEIIGAPVAMTDAGLSVVQSALVATIIAFFGNAAVLYGLLKSLRDTFLVLLPMGLSALLFCGLVGFFNMPFNYANVIMVPLLIGLSVDSGVHIVLRRRESGSGLAVLNSSTSRGVALSALTNVVSCGSLALSSHRGTASMGEFLTLALILTLATSLVVLPALLEFLDQPRRVVTPS